MRARAQLLWIHCQKTEELGGQESGSGVPPVVFGDKVFVFFYYPWFEDRYGVVAMLVRKTRAPCAQFRLSAVLISDPLS